MNDFTVNSMTNDAMGDCDATALAKRIADKEVSAAEVLEAAIARAELVNPKLNAIVTESYDLARQHTQSHSANSLLKSGAFAGVPTFIKDNTDVKGLPTLFGSLAVANRPAKGNGEFTDQMLSTGLTILGKSALPEFGIPPVTESVARGATCNPWNINHSSGGSSGGAAALVAAGVVPIAHGNDGGGSTRIPAACCGLVGLKPTRNRLVNMHGTEALPINVGHEGVITRSVRDTALFMAEAEKHFRNPKLVELGHVQAPSKKRLRIGIITGALKGIAIQPDVQRTLNETGLLCESLGHHVEEIAFPFEDQIADDFITYYSFLFFSLHRFGKFVIGSGFDSSKVEKLCAHLSNSFVGNMGKFPFVVRRLKNAINVTRELHKHYDVLLCPTLSSSAPKNNYICNQALPASSMIKNMTEFAPFAALQNITGEPAISLPMGTSDNGLPIGMQFSAGYGEDKTLLELAYELEEAKAWKHIYQMVAKKKTKRSTKKSLA
ncbi:MAG: amidase [Oleispira sp.]